MGVQVDIFQPSVDLTVMIVFKQMNNIFYFEWANSVHQNVDEWQCWIELYFYLQLLVRVIKPSLPLNQEDVAGAVSELDVFTQSVIITCSEC